MDFDLQSSYQRLTPERSHTPVKNENDAASAAGSNAPVELVTVPVLGAEWKKSEMEAMTKRGRKKGKKGGAAPAEAKGFNCPPAVIEDCSYLKIDPPASAADVPAVVEKIKEKLDHWKGDQAAQTKKVCHFPISTLASLSQLTSS